MHFSIPQGQNYKIQRKRSLECYRVCLGKRIGT